MQFNPVKICINSHPPLEVVGAGDFARPLKQADGAAYRAGYLSAADLQAVSGWIRLNAAARVA
jgi:hypothetical protein